MCLSRPLHKLLKTAKKSKSKMKNKKQQRRTECPLVIEAYYCPFCFTTVVELQNRHQKMTMCVWWLSLSGLIVCLSDGARPLFDKNNLLYFLVLPFLVLFVSLCYICSSLPLIRLPKNLHWENFVMGELVNRQNFNMKITELLRIWLWSKHPGSSLTKNIN